MMNNEEKRMVNAFLIKKGHQKSIETTEFAKEILILEEQMNRIKKLAKKKGITFNSIKNEIKVLKHKEN